MLLLSSLMVLPQVTCREASEWRPAAHIWQGSGEATAEAAEAAVTSGAPRAGNNRPSRRHTLINGMLRPRRSHELERGKTLCSPAPPRCRPPHRHRPLQGAAAQVVAGRTTAAAGLHNARCGTEPSCSSQQRGGGREAVIGLCATSIAPHAAIIMLPSPPRTPRPGLAEWLESGAPGLCMTSSCCCRSTRHVQHPSHEFILQWVFG